LVGKREAVNGLAEATLHAVGGGKIEPGPVRVPCFKAVRTPLKCGMGLQDLTPQLRTRLSRVERAVGWFVLLAAALLVFGFVYYLYHTAERKGWFTPKFSYQTSLNTAAGLKVGDPVRLLGFRAGEITEIIPNAPDDWYGVTINFSILKPHYGYIWDDSKVKVSSDLLGNRFLEVTKGKFGVATLVEDTNRMALAMLRWQSVAASRERVAAQILAARPGFDRADPFNFNSLLKDELKHLVESDPATYRTNLNAVFWIAPEESPALNDRLEHLATQVEQALPNLLNLTNKVALALDNAVRLEAGWNAVALSVQPLLGNLTRATARLDREGGLGEWLLPTGVQRSLDATLISAGRMFDATGTNLTGVFSNLDLTLGNLAGITSNLNAQVGANTNLLGQISRAVVDTDNLVQGLKRHWLLRSAFKGAKTNSPPARPKGD